MSEVDAKGLGAILLSYISSVASYPRESNRVGLSVTTVEGEESKRGRRVWSKGQRRNPFRRLWTGR